MGTQKNCHNETVLLSIKKMLNLMNKKIFSVLHFKVVKYLNTWREVWENERKNSKWQLHYSGEAIYI